MIKLFLFIKLLLITGLITKAQETKLLAPPYPESEKANYDNSPGAYLTNDDYETVKAFYLRLNNTELNREEQKGENGRKCRISAKGTREDVMEENFHQSGIIITTEGGNSKAVKKVFDHLRDGSATKRYPEEKYEEMKNKYSHLKYYHYPKVFNERMNRQVCITDQILEKYRNVNKNKTESMEMTGEEVQKEFNRLMSEGKMQEAGELMKNHYKGVSENMQEMITDYSIWEDCLEEMAKHAYKTHIQISFDN